jgi:antitoxin YefM
MADFMTVTQARARLSEVVDQVRRTREPLTLTRNGRPAAVLVDPDEWVMASRALEFVEDAAAVREYDEAVAAWDGSAVPLAGVLAELAEDEAATTRAAG